MKMKKEIEINMNWEITNKATYFTRVIYLEDFRRKSTGNHVLGRRKFHWKPPLVLSSSTPSPVAGNRS